MDYWKECIEIAFEEAGITATDEQIDQVAGSVEGGHENYGMARGYDAIPNPRDSEVERLKNKIKKMEEAHERQLSGVIAGVARRRNIHPSQVYIEDDGRVKYDLI